MWEHTQLRNCGVLTPHCVHLAHILVTMDTRHMLLLPCTNCTIPDTMHLPLILITIPPYVTVHPLAPTAHQHTTEPFTNLTIS